MKKLIWLFILLIFCGCYAKYEGFKQEGDKLKDQIEDQQQEPNTPHPRDWGLS